MESTLDHTGIKFTGVYHLGFLKKSNWKGKKLHIRNKNIALNCSWFTRIWSKDCCINKGINKMFQAPTSLLVCSRHTCLSPQNLIIVPGHWAAQETTNQPCKCKQHFHVDLRVFSMQCQLTMHTRQKHSGCVSCLVSERGRFLSYFRDLSQENISPHYKLGFEFCRVIPSKHHMISNIFFFYTLLWAHRRKVISRCTIIMSLIWIVPRWTY